MNKVKYKGKPAFHLVYAELIRAARYRGVTTYQEIARVGGLPTSGHAMASATGIMLGEIVDQELGEGRPMLSAVCVSTSGKPSDGFYNYALELGRMKADTKAEREAFWRLELAAVYEAWSKP